MRAQSYIFAFLSTKQIETLFMSNIKNIIFDLGNVIIDLDMERFDKSMKALWGTHYENARIESEKRQFFEKFETGDISPENFIWNWQHIYDQLESKGSTLLEPNAIIKTWNSMLGPIHPARFEMLKRLKAKYKLYIYSNTNSIHIEWVNRYLKSEYQSSIPDFEKKYFEKVYYSHIIRARKPHIDGFLWILDDADLVAEETLFIDDKMENIEGAKLAGIQGLHHPVGKEIVDVLREF